MASPREAKIGYLCPICDSFLQVKKEGRTEGEIKDCKTCGEPIIYKSIVIIKPEPVEGAQP